MDDGLLRNLDMALDSPDALAAWMGSFGDLLRILDPSVGPKVVFDQLWARLREGGVVRGIWFHAKTGHFVPAGYSLVGDSIPDGAELAAACGPAAAPLNGASVPVIGRQIKDGNILVAAVLVTHVAGQATPAILVAEAIARWCLDRRRMQVELSELSEENVALRGYLASQVQQHEIRTVSKVMDALIRSAAQAASSTATVLIQGETGTGKEMLARFVHSRSQRSTKPMISVNVAALSPTLLESELFGHVRGAFTGADQERKGLFEVADSGTLFLDEVGEMSPETQVRLLRVLQERCITRVGDHRPIPVDVRIIAATHRDLFKEVEVGRFREDLFYRLHVVSLNVPPLRKRPEDIPLLVAHFLEKFNRDNFKQVSEIPRAVMEMLCAYPWPGNIRELENCVQKAVVLAPGTRFPAELVPVQVRSWSEEHPLPTAFRINGDEQAAKPVDPEQVLRQAVEGWIAVTGSDIGRVVDRVERLVLTWALTREQGIKMRAARLLGINRVTLDRKLAAHGLEVRRSAGVVTDRPDAER